MDIFIEKTLPIDFVDNRQQHRRADDDDLVSARNLQSRAENVG